MDLDLITHLDLFIGKILGEGSVQPKLRYESIAGHGPDLDIVSSFIRTIIGIDCTDHSPVIKSRYLNGVIFEGQCPVPWKIAPWSGWWERAAGEPL